MSDQAPGDIGVWKLGFLIALSVFACIGVVAIVDAIFQQGKLDKEISPMEYNLLALKKVYADEEVSAKLCELLADGKITNEEYNAFEAWDDQRMIAKVKAKLCGGG